MIEFWQLLNNEELFKIINDESTLLKFGIKIGKQYFLDNDRGNKSIFETMLTDIIKYQLSKNGYNYSQTNIIFEINKCYNIQYNYFDKYNNYIYPFLNCLINVNDETDDLLFFDNNKSQLLLSKTYKNQNILFCNNINYVNKSNNYEGLYIMIKIFNSLPINVEPYNDVNVNDFDFNNENYKTITQNEYNINNFEIINLEDIDIKKINEIIIDKTKLYEILNEYEQCETNSKYYFFNYELTKNEVSKQDNFFINKDIKYIDNENIENTNIRLLIDCYFFNSFNLLNLNIEKITEINILKGYFINKFNRSNIELFIELLVRKTFQELSYFYSKFKYNIYVRKTINDKNNNILYTLILHKNQNKNPIMITNYDKNPIYIGNIVSDIYKFELVSDYMMYLFDENEDSDYIFIDITKNTNRNKKLLFFDSKLMKKDINFDNDLNNELVITRDTKYITDISNKEEFSNYLKLFQSKDSKILHQFPKKTHLYRDTTKFKIMNEQNNVCDKNKKIISCNSILHIEQCNWFIENAIMDNDTCKIEITDESTLRIIKIIFIKQISQFLGKNMPNIDVNVISFYLIRYDINMNNFNLLLDENEDLENPLHLLIYLNGRHMGNLFGVFSNHISLSVEENKKDNYILIYNLQIKE